MPYNFPFLPAGDGPGDGQRHPNWRLAHARLLKGRYEPASPLRAAPAAPTASRIMDPQEVGSRWLFRSASLGHDDFGLQAAVSGGLIAAGQPGLGFQLLALPLSRCRCRCRCRCRAVRPVAAPAGRAAAIDMLARMATEHLAIRDAEPDLTVSQAVLDGAQSALWMVRNDRRHWVSAQRLLLSRTLALRQQVASEARVLRYADFPTQASLLRALDRNVTWLRVLSLGDVAALGVAPEMPEQPIPPGYNGAESA